MQVEQGEKRKMKNEPYNVDVMAGRPAEKEAPLFGQRLAAVRRNKGLTQKQLGDKMTVKRELIDYYERRSPNPALDFIERAAAALDVSVAELLGSEPNASRAKPGPQSQLQRKFEQVKLLPREKQKFVLQFLDTVLDNQQKQKA
jgi:transcriptional regulator with XRE-family HTH domain